MNKYYIPFFRPPLWWQLAIYFVSLSFIVNSLTLQAQSPNREQLVGNWIGVRIDFDEHVSRAYPIYMKLDADSTFTLGLLDAQAPTRRSNWSVTDKKIRLDTNTYSRSQWALKDQMLSLSGAYPILFRKLTNIAIDSAFVRETLTGYSWETDSLVYHFHHDGSACLENTRTDTRTIHCWRLTQIDQSVFLVIKGSAEDCTGNFKFPQQITRLETNLLECVGGQSGTERLSLKRSKKLGNQYTCQPKGFQTCNSFISHLFKLYPYFTYTRGRLYDISQIVKREYKPVDQPGQSGLIRFRFVVNCKGEAGQFDVLEVDENYQLKTFDPRIKDQLLTICRTKITQWEPGKQNENQQPTDTYCLLTFRLKDGIITEIFP